MNTKALAIMTLLAWGAVARALDIFQAVEVKVGEKRPLTFNAPPTPEGREAALTLKARLDSPRVSGYHAALRLWLNGKPLSGARLLDRPQTMTMADGRTQSAAHVDHLTIPYAPDFEATDQHPSYALRGVQACQFALRVTDLLKEGANLLVIENTARAPLIGNGAPHTRTAAQLHFPRFVETGSISNCARAQLYTPIALGDHLTERSEVDAYRVMLRALDYGCVYYWYNDMTVIPTHPHLTHFMFPITPLELHEGFIIGKERILTNRSGVFGWGDHSKHEVHVFNDEGRAVAQSDRSRYTKTVVRNGKTLTELRIAEGWSAAIVSKGRAGISPAVVNEKRPR